MKPQVRYKEQGRMDLPLGRLSHHEDLVNLFTGTPFTEITFMWGVVCLRVCTRVNVWPIDVICPHLLQTEIVIFVRFQVYCIHYLCFGKV